MDEQIESQATHEVWFRTSVREALDDQRLPVPHRHAMDEARPGSTGSAVPMAGWKPAAMARLPAMVVRVSVGRKDLTVPDKAGASGPPQAGPPDVR